MSVQATLETTSIEMCIYDENEHRCYVNAFEKLAIGMSERRADDMKTTDAVTKHADLPKDVPALSPNDVEVPPAVTKPTLGLSIRKQTYAKVTHTAA